MVLLGPTSVHSDTWLAFSCSNFVNHMAAAAFFLTAQVEREFWNLPRTRVIESAVEERTKNMHSVTCHDS